MSANKAYVPMKVLRVTQGRNTGSHKNTWANDLGGEDTGISQVFAPCDMVIVRVRTDGKNNGEVYAQSTSQVELPMGGSSIVHFTFIHDNYYNPNVKVGAVIKQNEYFYDEGGKSSGKPGAYDSHLHLEAGLGASPAYQFKNGSGCWMTPNTRPLEDILWLKKDTKVLNSGGYAWKRDSEEQDENKSSEEDNMQFYSVFGTKNCQFFNSKNVDDVAGSLRSGINYPVVSDEGNSGGLTWVSIFVSGEVKFAVLLGDRSRLIKATDFSAKDVATTINDQCSAKEDTSQLEQVTSELNEMKSKFAETTSRLTKVESAMTGIKNIVNGI